MTTIEFTPELLKKQSLLESFKLVRFQVLNWGTYDGYHDIFIDSEGHLIVGGSGTGKSTLLDAYSLLTVNPKRRIYNAASNDDKAKKNDRDNISYIRGAYSKKSADGEEVVQYHRNGSVTSAVVATYKNSLGDRFSLLTVMTIRGVATSKEKIGTHRVIAKREVELTELNTISPDKNELKKYFGSRSYFPTFTAYSARLEAIFEFDADQTLKLLHKAQSIKSISTVSNFCKEFMLSESEAYKITDKLVRDYTQLKGLNDKIEQLEHHVISLSEVRDLDVSHTGYLANWEKYNELLNNLNIFSDKLEKSLSEDKKNKLDNELVGHKESKSQIELKVKKIEDKIFDLRSQIYNVGGGELQRYENELSNSLNNKKHIENNRSDANRLLKQLKGKELIADELQQFIQQKKQWQEELCDLDENSLKKKYEQSIERRAAIRKELNPISDQIRILLKSKSNITGHQALIREEICDALNIPQEDLPFIAELIEVDNEYSEWQGAIERVLHSFGLTLLVPEQYIRQVDEYARNNYLKKTKIVYELIRDNQLEQDVVLLSNFTDGMLHRLNTKSTVYQGWLNNQLMKRFDYRCVDKIESRPEPMLTITGLIKISSSKRIKDDRYEVNNSYYWNLGFSNIDKRKSLEEKRKSLEELLEKLDIQVEKFSALCQEATSKRSLLTPLLEREWADFDLSSVLQSIDEIQRKIDDIKSGNAELEALEVQLDKSTEGLGLLKKDFEKVVGTISNLMKDISKLILVIKSIDDKNHPVLSDTNTNFFEAAFDSIRSLSMLERKKAEVDKSLSIDLEKTEGAIKNCQLDIRRILKAFVNDNENSGLFDDFVADFNGRKEFIKYLESVEREQLIELKVDFKKMLDEQTTQQVSKLSQEIERATQNVISRIAEINESLQEIDYNPETFLKITDGYRATPEYTEMKQYLREVSSELSDTSEEAMKSRFEVMSKLLDKLNPNDSEGRNWKKRALDCREHFNFGGIEYYRHQNNRGEYEQKECLSSAFGKSGGQKEKLATTIVAASLRFQLSNDLQSYPRFSTVLIDEAFLRSDSKFIQTVMSLYQKLGFQMIIATPGKSVQALEEFLPGVTLTIIKQDKYSYAIPIDIGFNEHKEIILKDKSGRVIKTEGALDEELKGNQQESSQ